MATKSANSSAARVSPRKRPHKSRPAPRTPAEFGVLAIGTEGQWTVSVDEQLDRGGRWFLELECPSLYLTFHLRDSKTVPELLALLRSASDGTPHRILRTRLNDDGALPLGNFGETPVSIIRDTETPERCFLIVSGAETHSSFRLTLLADDVRSLVDAIKQAVSSLDVS